MKSSFPISKRVGKECMEGESIAGDAFFQAGRSGETAAAICNLQKSERFCRSVNGRANWKTSVRRLPVTGARSARLRSLPFCRPTADFPRPDFRLTSPRSFLFLLISPHETNHSRLAIFLLDKEFEFARFFKVIPLSINTTRRRSERGGGRTARFNRIIEIPLVNSVNLCLM